LIYEQGLMIFDLGFIWQSGVSLIYRAICWQLRSSSRLELSMRSRLDLRIERSGMTVLSIL